MDTTSYVACSRTIRTRLPPVWLNNHVITTLIATNDTVPTAM